MFSQLSIEKLGYYVYLLKDPFDPRVVFYVGKGTGNRVFAHLNDALESETSSDKLDFIREILKAGEKPIHVIVRHGMDEATAFEVEGALIDAYGLEDLKNEQNGHGNRKRGLRDWKDIEIEYGAVPVIIDDPVVLLKSTSHSWDRNLNRVIYDKIRSDWWISDYKVNSAKYALIVRSGIVREIYKIDRWERNPLNIKSPRKRMFFGEPAEGPIRDKYLHRDVSAYFPIPRLQKTYAGIPSNKKIKKAKI
jgi:hypothetical protein